MKVFILHRKHDYGAHSVYLKKETAEQAKVDIEKNEWDRYRLLENSDPLNILLKEEDFHNTFYIHEIEVIEK